MTDTDGSTELDATGVSTSQDVAERLRRTGRFQRSRAGFAEEVRPAGCSLAC